MATKLASHRRHSQPLMRQISIFPPPTQTSSLIIMAIHLFRFPRRTADVRSVGYSELFSLSREDVLAAMKDYPEAQDILQTLGRKRLMEVRCVNKKHAKMQSDKEAAERAAEGESASKRIVDKLRSDVKGIRNVLKKTRYVPISLECKQAHIDAPIVIQTQYGTAHSPDSIVLCPPVSPFLSLSPFLSVCLATIVVWTTVFTIGRIDVATNRSNCSHST